MPKENTEIANTIKYSIWDTKTNDNQPDIHQRSAKSAEGTALESIRSGKQM